jgi:hypothetical protein
VFSVLLILFSRVLNSTDANVLTNSGAAIGALAAIMAVSFTKFADYN